MNLNNWLKSLFRDEELIKELRKINNHLEKLSKCVKQNPHPHGDRSSISTKHWNDWS